MYLRRDAGDRHGGVMSGMSNEYPGSIHECDARRGSIRPRPPIIIHGLVVLAMFAALLCASVVPSLQAQPTLTLKRIDSRQYPLIRLVFRVDCAGAYRPDMLAQHFIVRENGLPVKDVTVRCVEDTNCCVSTVLVLDRSGSMAWQDETWALRKYTLEYIDAMNPDGIPCDETGIISFNENVTLDVEMTTDKQGLKDAVQQYVGRGRTAVFDAVAAGIAHLADRATNRCRGVIVFSDGGENASQTYHMAEEVAAFALANDVRVYPLYGGSQQLEYIARQSGGGMLPHVGEAGRAAMLNEFIKNDFKECVFSYVSTCPDGGKREVEMLLAAFCGDSAVARGSYVAPLDSTQFSEVRLRIGDGDVQAGRDVLVPMLLESPVHEIFAQSEVRLRFDTSRLRLRAVQTAGALMEGHAITFEELADGARIRFGEHVELDTDGGVLLHLQFTAADRPSIDAPIAIVSWDFAGYCLVPTLKDGMLRIRREPLLTCEISVPDTILWNDAAQRYDPDPMQLEVRVHNSGSWTAWDVHALLESDTARIELLAPATDRQRCSPWNIAPGATGVARWQARLRRGIDLASIPLRFHITASNHASITCASELRGDASRRPALACAVTAPDTVYFREQYYEPQEFAIHVEARNVGDGGVSDVRAQLLQDTRFTASSPSLLQLADLLLPGAAAGGVFRVRIHPRDTDGFDTVRVHVQGGNANPTWCLHPVWVQRVRLPRFDVSCKAEVDSLHFDDATGDYIPNPFTVTATVVNAGETFAEECEIVLLGTPGLTPVGRTSVPLGTMQVGDTRQESWSLRALPRPAHDTDTLEFQVRGKGGLGRQLVVAECRTLIRIPAVRRASYALDCDGPDSLRFQDGRYDPDPFVLTARLTNTGTAIGRAVVLTAVLPSGVSLADGESAVKSVGEIGAGMSVIVEWLLIPRPQHEPGVFSLCVRAADAAGFTTECCTSVHIPEAQLPDLRISCLSIDTLYLDNSAGGYHGNPFEVSVLATNIGGAAVRDVRITLRARDAAVRLLDTAEQRAGTIEPGAAVRLVWRVEARTRSLAANVLFEAFAMGDGIAPAACEVSVYIPAAVAPRLSARCFSIPDDSVRFNWSTARFDAEELLAVIEVTNHGPGAADNVRALLVLPPGMLLQQGESTLKALEPPILPAGSGGRMVWRLQPLRDDPDAMRGLHFVVDADNTGPVDCTDSVWVQGSARHLTVSLPRQILLRHGEQREIPLEIDRTIGKELEEYILYLSYDPAVMAPLGVTAVGTLTNVGWVGPRLEMGPDGHIAISDYTTGTPLAGQEGVLVRLRVQGRYGGSGGAGEYIESPIGIDTVTSRFNRGLIALHARDGSVIATDPCLEPLVAHDGGTMHQSHPNPFETSCTISYRLADDAFVRLAVFDRHGREIRVLGDGQQSAGDHAVTFVAGALPAGMYFYRLVTAGGIYSGRMQLLK